MEVHFLALGLLLGNSDRNPTSIVSTTRIESLEFPITKIAHTNCYKQIPKVLYFDSTNQIAKRSINKHLIYDVHSEQRMAYEITKDIIV